MKVLIVEDSPMNAEMVRLSLAREGFEPILAPDGEHALGELEAHADFDLVITDVMMPGLNGLEMLERIRQRPEFETLPVVMTTSLADPATVRRAASLQCKHFIVKPFTVPLLLKTVHEALGLRGPILEDKERALERIGIDTADYDQLALAFASFVRERVTSLRQLCDGEEQCELDDAMRRDLFQLGEGAALLGAERLGHVLRALDLPGRTLPPEKLGGVCKALVSELRLLLKLLPEQRKSLRLDAAHIDDA